MDTTRITAPVWPVRLLVTVQCLLLAINYSILIADKTMPKVANLGNLQDLEQGQEAWLVWDGKEWMTYLVRSKDTRKLDHHTPQRRQRNRTSSLTTPILRVLFAERASQTVPQLEGEKGGRSVKKNACTLVHPLVALLPIDCLC